MNFFSSLKNSFLRGIFSLFRRGKKPSPLADRILADAFLLGNIPSPSAREEERAFFVSERLKALSIPHTVDENGNILARLHGKGAAPLLLFTGLACGRWKALDGLGRLDTQYARGAGLSGALGPAALLSVAENYVQGPLIRDRDILLFFSASAFDDPSKDVFLPFASGNQRPFAALGIRGLALGSLYNPVLGSRRLEIKFSRPQNRDGQSAANSLAGALVGMASRYLDGGEGAAQNLFLGLRRIEAQTSRGRFPDEGVLELVLESAEKAALDGALERIMEDSRRYHSGPLSCLCRVVSDIPPSDNASSAFLCEVLKNVMKDQKIKCEEDSAAEASSFLVNMGIPAVSFGFAGGREGLDYDTVEIATVEKGRLLLETCVEILSREETPR